MVIAGVGALVGSTDPTCGPVVTPAVLALVRLKGSAHWGSEPDFDSVTNAPGSLDCVARRFGWRCVMRDAATTLVFERQLLVSADHGEFDDHEIDACDEANRSR